MHLQMVLVTDLKKACTDDFGNRSDIRNASTNRFGSISDLGNLSTNSFGNRSNKCIYKCFWTAFGIYVGYSMLVQRNITTWVPNSTVILSSL